MQTRMSGATSMTHDTLDAEKDKSFASEENIDVENASRENCHVIDPDKRLDSGDIKKSKSEIYIVTEKGKRELRSPFADSDQQNNAAKRDNPSVKLWTTAAIEDELTFQLSSAISFEIDANTQVIHITHKYYDQAAFILRRINLYRPPPDFVIYLSDITPKLRSHLGQLNESSPIMFHRVVTDSVQNILENINQRYYHVSNIAYKVRWRFEP